MGGICPDSKNPPPCQNKKSTKISIPEPQTSHRAINNIPRANLAQHIPEYPPQPQQKQNMNISVQSNTTEKVEKNTKAGQNKTNSSSEINGKNSMNSEFSSQVFNIQSSSIIRNIVKDRSPDLKKELENCYVLIDNIFLVRKSQDNVKVVSPYSQSRLNCPLNTVASTFYITDGIPFGSFKQIGQLKIIQSSESPIITKMKLVCKNCQKKKKSSKSNSKVRQVKMTFATSLIQPNQITCDQCGKKDQWRLLSIESNFPVWGNGDKIGKDTVLDTLPSTIRVMGCINCFYYPTQYQKLRCGCIMCPSCYQQNETKQCKLCELIQ